MAKKKATRRQAEVDPKITYENLVKWAKAHGLKGKVEDKPRVKTVTLTISYRKHTEPKSVEKF